MIYANDYTPTHTYTPAHTQAVFLNMNVQSWVFECLFVRVCALRIALNRKSKSGLDQEEKCVRGTNKSGKLTPFSPHSTSSSYTHTHPHTPYTNTHR